MLEFLAPLLVFAAPALFLGILASLELGRRLGKRHLARYPESLPSGTAAVEGAVFGLMGLLLAFSFSGAMSRWDARRDLVVEETNAIGTAWLRIDLLPAESQPALRDLFRRYTDARLRVYFALPDVEEARAELALATQLQQEIWTQAVVACDSPEGEKVRILLIPALNAMIDITTNRTMALLTHPPIVIYALLFALALASALLAGYAMSPAHSRSWVHMLGFAAAVAVGVYVILDLEFPRAGLIRIDAVDEILIELRASMK